VHKKQPTTFYDFFLAGMTLRHDFGKKTKKTLSFSSNVAHFPLFAITFLSIYKNAKILICLRRFGKTIVSSSQG
jgi:hypothetical protein